MNVNVREYAQGFEITLVCIQMQSYHHKFVNLQPYHYFIRIPPINNSKLFRHYQHHNPKGEAPKRWSLRRRTKRMRRPGIDWIGLAGFKFLGKDRAYTRGPSKMKER
jgi:hypothetical protein